MAPSLDPTPADVSSQPVARSAGRQWLWLPAIAVVVFAIYLPGLGNLAVFDDAFYTDGALKSRYSEMHLRPRMLSYGTFLWLDTLFGEGLWKQRLANIAFHLGVVVALWGFYREILRSIVPPAPEPGEEARPLHESRALGLAIGFFALNPVAVYAVAYLIQRSILMATLFVVLGLWLFARALRTGIAWLHAPAVLCYALAVLSKENAILGPLAMLPVYVLVARPSRKRLAVIAGVGALLVGIAGALLALRFGNILGTPFDEFSRVYIAQLAALNPNASKHAWALSIENQAWLFFEYGLRWFLPVADWTSINMRPPFPVQWSNFPQLLGVPLYVGAITGASWLLLRQRDWRALAGLSVLLPALLFASEFATVWVQDPFVLYRSYLWAIGVPGLVFCFVHGPSTRALVVVAIVVGLLLSWQAIERVLSLSTPETAWTDAIQKLPRDPRAVGRWFPYLNRGSYYADRDQFELAIRDFEASSTLGDMGMGAFNTGSMLNALGKPQQALAAFERAEKQGYDLYNLPFQRGIALAALGKPREAYHQFDIARFMIPPSMREILALQLGRTALQTGQPDEAIRNLQEYVRTDPQHAEARYLLSMAHISKAEHARALEVLAGGPLPAGAGPYARALAYHGLGRKPEASREIDEAIRARPDNPVLREWRAKILAMP
ncbi:MAG TPA: tetratricopeptide repeat protein [Usitatibacter sp.]|nr:tetratricopeptide repeat protein [Usitatibacter sp.]